MKKKKQFVDLDTKYYYKPLIITKKIQKFLGDVKLFTLPSISFFVMKIGGSKYSIYNKEISN